MAPAGSGQPTRKRRLLVVDDNKDAVLIAITGYGQEDDRLRSRRAGIDHHLVKPVAPDALQSLIDSLRAR